MKMWRHMYLTPEQLKEPERHQLPGISGVHILGSSMVCLSTAEAMEQNFIKYPKQTTKSKHKRDAAKLILGDAIFFKLTEDVDFN